MKIALPVLLAAMAAQSGRGTEKPRIFVTDTSPVHLSGETLVAGAKGSVSVTGGAGAQNVEVMKAFLERCPGVVVTGNSDRADYIVRVNYEAPNPTTLFVRNNKIAVFDRNDEMIYGTSARLLRSAVKDACAAIAVHAGVK